MNDKDKPLILFTTMNDLSSFGGIETQIPQEVQDLHEKGYRIHVISRPPRGKTHVPVADGITLSYYPPVLLKLPWLVKDTIVSLWIALNVRRLARESSLVVISFGVMDGSGVALARLTGTKLKLIQRVPGPISYEVVHFTPAKKFRYRMYAHFYRLVEMFSYLVSDIVLPVSEFEEANVHSYGIEGPRVRMLRCGIDENRFPSRSETKTLNIPSDHQVVMFVGRLYEKNGPLVIAKAIPEVIGSKPKTAFVFVGDGPMRKDLESRLADAMRTGNVIFTGFRKDIPQLLSEADIYSGHLSSDMDGIGQTVMEALMSGLPVIVGRDPITEKMIINGQNGILIQKDDPNSLVVALNDLLDKPSLQKDIGVAGRQFALKSLSFASMMNELVAEVEKDNSNR